MDLWSPKTWRGNFFVLVWEVKNSRARTKKFPRHVFRKLRPQSEHFRARNFSACKIRRPFTSSA
nr:MULTISPECIES: DUF1661 domain-containing protein [Porphyromonas]